MQNLAIFHESNKDAAYYRQQVSERGVLEKIDALNDGLLRINGIDEENLSRIYEVLNDIEISLNKNANDPRTRMALQDFTVVDEKVEETAPATEDDNTEEHTEETQESTGKTDPAEDTDGIQKLAEEPTGEPNPAENTEETTNETQEPTTESTGGPATEQQEPTDEIEPAEKVDTQEPATEPATKPISETPQPKKSGRRKKDAE